MPSDASLQVGDTKLTLPEVASSAGNNGYRIGSLLNDTGAVTYDPGFANTASSSSAITYIDGDAGVLQYRGYPIEQLAEHSNFVEVSYLLIHGELPTQEQFDAFDGRLRGHTIVHEDLRRFFRAFPYDAHPMPMVAAAVAALSTFYQDDLDVFDEGQV
ncbi:MAG: citrate (Si)-synthase, partial [Brevibacterium sp.]|nr:citrate (Si)-synthase [Brevibacterium sp.]